MVSIQDIIHEHNLIQKVDQGEGSVAYSTASKAAHLALSLANCSPSDSPDNSPPHTFFFLTHKHPQACSFQYSSSPPSSSPHVRDAGED